MSKADNETPLFFNTADRRFYRSLTRPAGGGGREGGGWTNFLYYRSAKPKSLAFIIENRPRLERDILVDYRLSLLDAGFAKTALLGKRHG